MLELCHGWPRHARAGTALRVGLTALVLAFGLAAPVTSRSVAAQASTVDPVGDSLIKADLRTRAVAPAIIPFGQPFVIRGAVPDTTGAVFLVMFPRLRYGRAVTNREKIEFIRARKSAQPVCTFWVRDRRRTRARTTESEFALPADLPLLPRTTYDAGFMLLERWDRKPIIPPPPRGSSRPRPRADSTELANRCDPAVALRQPDADSVPGAELLVTDSVVITAVTGGTVEDHFKFDVGYVYGFRSNYSAFATTGHLYFRPVSRRTDLDNSGMTPGEELFARLSLQFGLAVLRTDRSPEVSPRFALGAPVVGVGFRSPLYGYWKLTWARGLLQPIRLNAGALVLEQEHPNPLIDQRRTVWDPYIGVTYDIEIRSLLGPFAQFFGGR